jgi:hypothetical protein
MAAVEDAGKPCWMVYTVSTTKTPSCMCLRSHECSVIAHAGHTHAFAHRICTTTSTHSQLSQTEFRNRKTLTHNAANSTGVGFRGSVSVFRPLTLVRCKSPSPYTFTGRQSWVWVVVWHSSWRVQQPGELSSRQVLRSSLVHPPISFNHILRIEMPDEPRILHSWERLDSSSDLLNHLDPFPRIQGGSQSFKTS